MAESYTIARYTCKGERFEILVDPDKALSYKRGKEVPIREVLVADTIYSDANKGMKASQESLMNAFGTLDPTKIAETILRRGELLLTAEQRRRMIEEKRRQIIAYISRNCVDPRTKLPHPPLRVEQAMEQIHYPIDPFRDAEEQAKEVIELLRSVLPISVETMNLSIKIPAAHVGRAYGVVKGLASIKKEEWGSDGSWKAVVEVPAGSYGTLLEKLGQITRGSAEVTVLR